MGLAQEGAARCWIEGPGFGFWLGLGLGGVRIGGGISGSFGFSFVGSFC